MLSALQYTGSGNAARILLRAAMSALLNACSVGYPLSKDQILSEVDTALCSGSRDQMINEAARLDAFNNLPCPLGGPVVGTVNFRK